MAQRLGQKMDWIALELVRTRGMMDGMEERLLAKLDANTSRTLNASAQCAAMAKHHERSDAASPPAAA